MRTPISTSWKKYLHEQNEWISNTVQDIAGDILSIGSGRDWDNESRFYRSYFKSQNSYTTSDVQPGKYIDMVIDARNMKSISDDKYDAIFCQGVIEHIDDVPAAISEMTRILKAGGKLIISFAFLQPPHCLPLDFWRFTIPGIQTLLRDFDIKETKEMGGVPCLISESTTENFPITYWVVAIKKLRS